VNAADVVVVGAGCAGLSAACALAEAGARVVVVEARPVLGGRTFATRDRTTGDWVDNGQHVLLGCYHETLAYLARIGARDRIRVQSSLTVPMVDTSGRRSELRCPALPSPLQLVAGVLAWPALSFTDRLSVLWMSRALEARSRHDAESLTVRAWLRHWGQADRLVELLWEPLAVAALNQPIDHATAGTFVEVVRRMLGPGPDDAALVLPARSLTETFVDPAVTFLERRGGAVMAGAACQVMARDGRIDGVRIRDELLVASRVVSTVPWHAVDALFEVMPPALAPMARHAAAMDASPIVTVNLWFDGPVLDTPFIGLPGRSFQWAFEKRLVSPGHATHVSLVCSGAAEVVDRGNDELIALAVRELSGAVPAAAPARLLRGTAVRERRATFSLAAGQPPRPPTTTALEGFFLAGDWTATGLPATIESAVVSGHRAARAVLDTLELSEH
jgi:hydroxysqualene dehydroxylase